jgi:hypothetical protein
MNNSPNSLINTTASTNPLKKCWKINGIFLVSLDKSIVQKLKINENDTFLEQEITEDGILMRIKKFNLREQK